MGLLPWNPPCSILPPTTCHQFSLIQCLFFRVSDSGHGGDRADKWEFVRSEHKTIGHRSTAHASDELRHRKFDGDLRPIWIYRAPALRRS